MAGVPEVAERDRLDQRGALAGPRPSDCFAGCGVTGQHIISVDSHAGDSVAGRSLGDLPHGELQLVGRGICELVVLHGKHDRELQNRAGVHRLMPRSGGRGALATVGQCHVRLAPLFKGQSPPQCDGISIGERGHHHQRALIGHTEMAVSIATLGGTSGLAEEVEQGFLEGHSPGQLGNQIAMGAPEDIAILECIPEPDHGGFLSHTRINRTCEPPPAVHGVESSLEQTTGDHQLIHIHQLSVV